MESKTQILKRFNVSYLGSTTSSQKVVKSAKNGVLTYILYLAPSTMSSDATHNINVCPVSHTCKEQCLSGSGHSLIEARAGKTTIRQARIRKTQAFYDCREDFMRVLIAEIKHYKNIARKKRMRFAVRLNGTSDLSPLVFKSQGKSILQLFPRTQFYDYTKVPARIKIRAKNYDLTFSYSGDNWDTCEEFLKDNGRVAVVFDMPLPLTYRGYRVIDGDTTDARFLDEQGVVVGLKYKHNKSDYKNGSYSRIKNTFVVDEENYIP